MNKNFSTFNKAFFIKVFVFSLLLLPSILYAAEERLLLNGKVKSINPDLKQVVVDVMNKGCNGVKTFNIDKISTIYISDHISEGNLISFFIDGAYCPRNEVGRIVEMWRVKK